MATVTLVYPKWSKIPQQTEFHLPPHGPVCVAASIPARYKVRFIDENVDAVDFSEGADLVLLSMMLTCQLPRGRQIAEKYRSLGVPVIAGGIATMLHADEVEQFVDSVFLGETEGGRLAKVLGDLEEGRLARRYDHLHDFPPMESVGPARRANARESAQG